MSKYDETVIPLRLHIFDQDNRYLGSKSVPVTKYVYNEHGAVVETVNLDKDRNIINHPETGVAITGTNFYETGNRMRL